VQLEHDNGGIIIDIGEHGLAMQAVRRLPDDPLPRMRFQFSQSYNWVETRGRIAWVSASRKIAGVEFVALNDEVRNKIKEWISLAVLPGACMDEAPGGRTERRRDGPTASQPAGSTSLPEREATGRVVANPRGLLIAEDPAVFLPISEIGSTANRTKRSVAAFILFVLVLGVAIGVLSLGHESGTVAVPMPRQTSAPQLILPVGNTQSDKSVH
jgi:hypothetical protein